MSDLKDYKWTVGQQWLDNLPESVAPPNAFRQEGANGVSHKHLLIVAEVAPAEFVAVSNVTAASWGQSPGRSPFADIDLAQYICDLHNAALAERSK